MENIVVMFEASHESTESLALALGLGAVQQGANIRLRHLDPSPTARLAHQSYGRLSANDLVWAQGIAIVLEEGGSFALEEITRNLDQLIVKGNPAAKIAHVFAKKAESELIRVLQQKLQAAGFQLLDVDEADRAATTDYLSQIGQRLAKQSA